MIDSKDADKALVSRVKNGHKADFDVLVIKYQHRILNLISMYVKDHQETKDIAQDTFIKAFRGINNFRGDSSFYTWLYRIAINTIKNFLIAQNRKSSKTIDINNTTELDMRASIDDAPEQLIICQEIEKKIKRTISSLPSDLKSVIMLREFEGLSYDEVAKIMGCPVGTIRSRIFRAREIIDKAILPLINSGSSDKNK